jgi:drug/metabolite transporter (DMT)-like permease
LSYVVFGYIPNLQAIIGLFVIMGSGLFVSWRVMKNNDGQAEDKEKLIEPL